MKNRPIEYFVSHPLLWAIAGILIIATIAWAATWQSYGTLSTDPASDDDILIRDVSDPSDPGTVKRMTWSNVETFLGNNADFWTGSAQSYLSNEIVVNSLDSLESAISVTRLLQQNDADPEFGVNDTTDGLLTIYGDNSTTGGISRWYNAAGEDSTISYWQMEANDTQVEIGPNTDTDRFVFDNTGDLSLASITMDANANPQIVMDDTAGSDFTFDLDASNLDFIMGSTSIMDMDTTDIVVNVKIDSSEGIEAAYIDAGIFHADLDGSDEDYGSSTICQAVFLLTPDATSDETFSLPDDPECSSGYGKKYCFSVDDAYDLYLSPQTGDNIRYGGANCGVSDDLLLATEGDTVCLVGISSTTWLTITSSGTPNCQ